MTRNDTKDTTMTKPTTTRSKTQPGTYLLNDFDVVGDIPAGWTVEWSLSSFRHAANLHGTVTWFDKVELIAADGESMAVSGHFDSVPKTKQSMAALYPMTCRFSPESKKEIIEEMQNCDVHVEHDGNGWFISVEKQPSIQTN